MKKKTTAKNDSKSLRTFFVYSLSVFVIIVIALSIRTFFVLRQSKFDGHNIAIVVTHNNRVVSVFGVNSDDKSVSILDIKKGNIPLDKLPEALGIIAESRIDSSTNLSGKSVDYILTKAIYTTDSIKTNLTIIDKIRLLLVSKSVSDKNIQKEELSYPADTIGMDKQITSLFSDSNIVSENMSIQIINATDIPGLGQKLERIITNRGGNVVAVSSARAKERYSKIRYRGKYSYTVKKLTSILKYPKEEMLDKSIGEVVIIIGEDYKKAAPF